MNNLVRASDITSSPNIGAGCLLKRICENVTAGAQFNAGSFTAQPLYIGPPPERIENMSRIDCLRAPILFVMHAPRVPQALNFIKFSASENLHAFLTHGICDGS